jgi:hypothetical protein
MVMISWNQRVRFGAEITLFNLFRVPHSIDVTRIPSNSGCHQRADPTGLDAAAIAKGPTGVVSAL